MLDILIALAALLASLAGVLVCWRYWRRDALVWPGLALAAAPWALATALWIGRFGAEIGIPLALETAALVAFAFILTRVERRPAAARRDRQAPPAPPRNYWRGAGRVLTAGVLGFAAAMAIAAVFATRAPLADSTRLILAALAMPSLWCAAIAWTVCDRRLLLQSAVFLMVGAGGLGLTLAAS